MSSACIIGAKNSCRLAGQKRRCFYFGRSCKSARSDRSFCSDGRTMASCSQCFMHLWLHKKAFHKSFWQKAKVSYSLRMLLSWSLSGAGAPLHCLLLSTCWMSTFQKKTKNKKSFSCSIKHVWFLRRVLVPQFLHLVASEVRKPQQWSGAPTWRQQMVAAQLFYLFEVAHPALVNRIPDLQGRCNGRVLEPEPHLGESYGSLSLCSLLETHSCWHPPICWADTPQQRGQTRWNSWRVWNETAQTTWPYGYLKVMAWHLLSQMFRVLMSDQERLRFDWFTSTAGENQTQLTDWNDQRIEWM